ncbi:chaplin [Actinomadura darangshiensis]|uniref:Chaplin n=1 Tax=Actinomadura darangshiensis TaxID=705336 RepID=A0A4R5B432_9ACTN|nr:chaplin [Actinomadura darangshiensis]TDD79036.1 chaplin [Actinomadura darangshiensis]
MRTWAKGTSRAAVLTASFVALGVSAIPVNAFADITNGSGGVLNGNQVDVPISAPVDVSGNSGGLLGTGYATSHGGVKIHKRRGAGQQTSGAHGIASGNQVNAPISLPVNVCGNAVGVLGEAEAGCEGGAKVSGGGADGQVTDGTGGVLAGNQVNAPISIPVNVCGNAVAIAGDAVGGCEGGSLVKAGGHTGSGQETSGIFGVGAGNQANAPISVPVDLCGNAIGDGAAACEGGASVRNGGHWTGRQTTDGAFGVISGNQGNAPISIPLTACGNAAALVGEAGAFCEGGAHARSSSGGDQHTSGAFGVLAGNQGNTPISIPAEICGNAAAVVGLAAASCNGQTLVEGPHGSGAQTSGDHGAGGGNQANAPTRTPADACGNAAAVTALAPAACEQGPGYGGYHPYSRTTNTTPANLPGMDGRLPSKNLLAEATGLGTTPVTDANGLTRSPATTALADGAALPKMSGALPDGLPGVQPQADGHRLKNVAGGNDLLKLAGLPAAGDLAATNALPKMSGALPDGLPGVQPQADGHRLKNVAGGNDLPAVGDLAAANALPAVGDLAAASAVPGTDGVLANGALPVPSAQPQPNGLFTLVGLPAASGVQPKAGARHTVASKNLLSNVRPGVDGVARLLALPKADGGALPGTGGVLANHGLPGGGPQVGGRRAPDGRLPSKNLPVEGTRPGTNPVTEANGLTRLVTTGDLADGAAPSKTGGVLAPENLPVGDVVSMLDTQALPGGVGLPKVPGRRTTKVTPTSVNGLKGADRLVAGEGLPEPVPGHGALKGVPGADGASVLKGGTGARVLPEAPVVPVTGAIGPVQQVAAHEAAADGTGAGSVWVLAASGVLAMAAGALALVRKARVGRR